MSDIILYREWISLPKEQFRLLAMIAASGNKYAGNYTDICNYLSVTPQSRNRNQIQSAIEALVDGGFIEHIQNGRTHHLQINPKATEIKIPLDLANSIIKHEYSSEDSAWEQVLKVYLWIRNNKLEIVNNAMIASDLDVSESTVIKAKNVLEREYETITKHRISEKIGENEYRTLGQELNVGAWWTKIT